MSDENEQSLDSDLSQKKLRKTRQQNFETFFLLA